MLRPLESPEALPGASDKIAGAAVESVNRNRMLKFREDDM